MKKNKFLRSLKVLSTIILISFSSNIKSNPVPDLQKSLSVVEINGQLSIKGNFLINKDNEIVVLKGMSLFWSQWMGKYYNYNCVKWLRDDWNCSVIRIAMGVQNDGYIRNPDREMKKVKKVIDACIDLGIYVIVDWHSHTAEKETESAIKFFSEIAALYGDHPNIIYEIFNEPLRVSWNDVIKPYSDSLISAIRKIDPDNIIIVGTPGFSQDVDVVANNPIIAENIAYAVHFYSATHKKWLRDKIDIALKKGLAIFVSEYGTCESSGNGKLDYEETKIWFEYMNKNHISRCNWSVADKNESSSILKKNASKNGKWSLTDLTESGKFVRTELRME